MCLKTPFFFGRPWSVSASVSTGFSNIPQKYWIQSAITHQFPCFLHSQDETRRRLKRRDTESKAFLVTTGRIFDAFPTDSNYFQLQYVDLWVRFSSFFHEKFQHLRNQSSSLPRVRIHWNFQSPAANGCFCGFWGHSMGAKNEMSKILLEEKHEFKKTALKAQAKKKLGDFYTTNHKKV